MPNTYQLDKWLWTESDFEIMGWHDSNIYAVTFSPEKFEIAFDIDYIRRLDNYSRSLRHQSQWGRNVH
jgi:hypothetical protein